jgi:hypothetical protein
MHGVNSHGSSCQFCAFSPADLLASYSGLFTPYLSINHSAVPGCISAVGAVTAVADLRHSRRNSPFNSQKRKRVAEAEYCGRSPGQSGEAFDGYHYPGTTGGIAEGAGAPRILIRLS